MEVCLSSIRMRTSAAHSKANTFWRRHRQIPPIRFYPSNHRSFSATSSAQSYLLPKQGYKRKARKGRPRVRTGGSVKGTTVVWGDYGIRMCDHHRRVSAAQLKVGEDTIRRRLKGEQYRFYARVAANIPVFTSGNEVRMGKGKGSFDHWASRIAVNKIIFELKGNMHEQVVRDAFRLAAAKMPGQYEFVKRGDPAVMGMTKLVPGVTKEDLFRPRLKRPQPPPSDESGAQPVLAADGTLA
ncbi:MAG: mitochondrial ribosomal large subunit component [Vezdaea aestivalis]|nr:MAG: mitochondrial ribosomal large subunit component [Vezdaea aestivalis]